MMIPSIVTLLPFLNEVSQEIQESIALYFGKPETCVFSARIAATFLEKLGYPAEIKAYYLDAYNPPLMRAILAGIDDPETIDEIGGAAVTIRPNPKTPEIIAGWIPYHLVAQVQEGDTLLIWDLSRDQVTRPQYKIFVSPGAFLGQTAWPKQINVLPGAGLIYEPVTDWQPHDLYDLWVESRFEQACISSLFRKYNRDLVYA